MTDHECADCGDEVDNKNAAGHYRDRCMACIQAIADEREPNPELRGDE